MGITPVYRPVSRGGPSLPMSNSPGNGILGQVIEEQRFWL